MDSSSDLSSFEYDYHPTPPISPIHQFSLLNSLQPASINLFPPLIPQPINSAKPNRPAHYEKNKNLTPSELENKHKERMIKNRLAAQESRDKKKNYVKNLETTNAQLILQNQLLVAQVQGTEACNKGLLEIVKSLSEKLSHFATSNTATMNSWHTMTALPFGEMLLPKVDDFTMPSVQQSSSSGIESNATELKNAGDLILDEIFDFDPPTIPSPPLSDTTVSSKKSIAKSTRVNPYIKPTSLKSKNCSLITISEPTSYTSNVCTLLKSSIPTKSDAFTTTLITSISFLALTTGSHYSNRHIFNYTGYAGGARGGERGQGFCGKKFVEIGSASPGLMIRNLNVRELINPQSMMKAFGFVKRFIK